MRKLNDKINLFCLRHPGFGIPNLIRYVMLGNMILYLMMVMDHSGVYWNMWDLLRFSPERIFHHWQLWRLVTFVFIPESGFWFVFYLYFYYTVGSELEAAWGPGKFTIFYLSGIVTTVICGSAIWYFTGLDNVVSTHFLNLCMIMIYATLYPDAQFMLFFLIPLKANILGLVAAALFVLNAVFLAFPQNLLPIAVALIYFVFCGEWLWDLVAGGRRQRQKNVVNFKREARRIKRESKDRPYNRKCEVCGRTDADYPDLEFRFCSRCTGYHCYCADHINDHVHHVD